MIKEGCQNCKSEFIIEDEDLEFYKKIDVPPPTFCPDCRFQRRAIFRNERKLFRRPDSNSGEQIFSGIPEGAPVKVYDHDYWWSDSWDSMAYGREMDFTRPFLEQVLELSREVPRPSRAVSSLINSDYTNNANNLKDCYLCFDGSFAEDCMYCVTFNHQKSCVDTYQSSENELCYENFSTGNCYKAFFSVDSSGCQNTWLCKGCMDCSDCFGSINLKHQKYYIFNQPYSKEDYFEKLKEFNLGSYESFSKLKKQAEEHWLKYPKKYMNGSQNMNATGDHIWESKNTKDCYQILRSENLSYCQNVLAAKDSMDYYVWGSGAELIYESVTCGENVKGLKFCVDCWPGCQDMEYSIGCRASANLFGCVSLKKKQYCILNKEYSKEEYKELVARIKVHMKDMPYTDSRGHTYSYGEFFSSDFSPNAYNETLASDFFPLTQQEAEAQGFLWREPIVKEFDITIQAKDLLDHINDVPEDITKEIISCMQCEKAFRYAPKEIEFYKRFTIPLPRLCAECRHIERLKHRNKLDWYTRACQCAGEKSENEVYQNLGQSHQSHPASEHCPNEFETTYPPDSKEIVYCEQCFQAEIV